MRPDRARLALCCEAACAAALFTALAGLVLGRAPVYGAALAVAVPAYFLCLYLSCRAEKG
jgi:hypothetical protein